MRFLFAALSALAVCATATFGAVAGQPAPSPTPIVLPTLPPDASANPLLKMGIDAVNAILRGSAERAANSARGQVTYFKRFEMQIRTGANGYREIHLHQGTIINPRGTTIAPGQNVSVSGFAQSDGSLSANEIDVQQ